MSEIFLQEKKTKSLYFERKDTILDKIVQKPIMRKIC